MSEYEHLEKYGYVITDNVLPYADSSFGNVIFFKRYGVGKLCIYNIEKIANILNKDKDICGEQTYIKYIEKEQKRKKRNNILKSLGI